MFLVFIMETHFVIRMMFNLNLKYESSLWAHTPPSNQMNNPLSMQEYSINKGGKMEDKREMRMGSVHKMANGPNMQWSEIFIELSWLVRIQPHPNEGPHYRKAGGANMRWWWPEGHKPCSIPPLGARAFKGRRGHQDTLKYI